MVAFGDHFMYVPDLVFELELLSRQVGENFRMKKPDKLILTKDSQ